MAMDAGGRGGAGYLRWRPPFTPQQWEELEQQALIFKHFLAGVPVPQDLLLPIRKGLDAMAAAAAFYHHHSAIAGGYGSYLGKKVDLEPGRCRRTDGKKWRCAKEAALDSKYCERHMHRGRNRSRKPVEAQPALAAATQSEHSPSASTVTSITQAGNSAGTPGAFQGHPLHGVAASSNIFALGPPQLQMDSYGTAATKDYRYNYGLRTLAGEHVLFAETNSGFGSGMREPGMGSSLENSCRMMQSQASSAPYHFSQSAYSSPGHSNYGAPYELRLNSENRKHGGGGHTLRHFVDEWPKARDAWPDLGEEHSNLALFPATQLSISTPMASSSDFSSTGPRSPNDGSYGLACAED